MGWISDSQHIIFSGNEPGHSSRFYLQDAKGGEIRPVSPEGFSSKLALPVSPDGKEFVALNQNTSAWNVCQIEDGKCAPLQGGEDDDSPLEWSADGKYIYVALQHPLSSVWRIELSTGHRQLWKRVTPGDSVGALEVLPSSITPDGKSFATQYDRSLDQLYVVEGLN
jgi:Tol biopolymer transport system component